MKKRWGVFEYNGVVKRRYPTQAIAVASRLIREIGYEPVLIGGA